MRRLRGPYCQLLARSTCRSIWFCAAVAASFSVSPAGEPVAKKIDYARQIKPILSNTCYFCHGPDPDERKGGTDGLRLDTEEGALADLGGHAAIVPGKPEESELIKRLTAQNDAERMPPPDSGKKVSDQEIALLREWITQGAKFAGHWSYAKPIRPELPVVRNSNWLRNEIDRFVLARLEQEGLAPAPEADRRTLIHRVSLDLTGLPPTPGEVEAFVADSDPQAYETLVDRLLTKEAYGEHFAYQWLDLARYADSAGYANDPPRSIWLFRDYVIRSLNANTPFDQFTIEQIAGDLLPNPTDDQRVATAFHRNTMTNNEGGTNDEEFRNVAIVDRVNTTMAVWMGSTFACAQCHTHKFDPFTQEEYFRLFAFFNNTTDADRNDEAPVAKVYSDEMKRELEARKEELAALEAKLNMPDANAKTAQTKWEESWPREVEWNVIRPSSVTTVANAPTTVADDGSILVGLKAPNDRYTLELSIPEGTLSALRFEALTDKSLPNEGPGHGAGNFVVTQVVAKISSPAGAEPMPVNFDSAITDFSQEEFDPVYVIKVSDFRNQGWAIGGEQGKPHELVLVASKPITVGPNSKLIMLIEHSSDFANHTLGKFRLSYTTSDQAAAWASVPPTIRDALRVPAADRSANDAKKLAAHFKATSTELATARQRIADVKPFTVPIMKERKKRRVTKVQLRGNYLAQAQEVTEGTPAIFPPLPEGVTNNRLALARWLVDENNPLTPRVIANRYWEQIFGIGIVSTSEDFGSQGDIPTHPELLDWLATELLRLRWDTKAFVRLLVTSAAYRQSSKVSTELHDRDPDNRLLARGPRIRLSAEVVRDQALAAAGLLSAKMYGPPVHPPQPSQDLKAAFGGSTDWQTSEGEDRYRRAIYTMWRRSNPYPSMAAFDAPNREVCTVRRVRTNTPLQALVTLNDPVYIEAAQGLARRVLTSEAKSFADRLNLAVLLCLSRPPVEEEQTRLARLYDETLARFKTELERAQKLASDPLGPIPPGCDPAELAAWTVVGNVLMNLDEFLMKR